MKAATIGADIAENKPEFPRKTLTDFTSLCNSQPENREQQIRQKRK